MSGSNSSSSGNSFVERVAQVGQRQAKMLGVRAMRVVDELGGPFDGAAHVACVDEDVACGHHRSLRESSWPAAASMSSRAETGLHERTRAANRGVASHVRRHESRRVVERTSDALQPRQSRRVAKSLARGVGIEHDGAGQRLLLGPVAHGQVVAGTHEDRGLEPQLREIAASNRQLLARTRAPREPARSRCRNGRGRERRPSGAGSLAAKSPASRRGSHSSRPSLAA